MAKEGREAKKPSRSTGIRCEVCGKDGFTRHSSLIRHVRQFHESKQPDEKGDGRLVNTENITGKLLEVGAHVQQRLPDPKPTRELPKEHRQERERGVRSSNEPVKVGHRLDREERSQKGILDVGETMVRKEEGSVVGLRDSGVKKKNGEEVAVPMMGGDATVLSGKVEGSETVTIGAVGDIEVELSMDNSAMGSGTGEVIYTIPNVWMEDDPENDEREQSDEESRTVKTSPPVKKQTWVRATKTGVKDTDGVKHGQMECKDVMTGLKRSTTRDSKEGKDKKRRVSGSKGSTEHSMRCDNCRITFEVRTMYRIHKRLHTNRAAFECSECGYRADGRVDFQVHFECAEARLEESTTGESDSDE